MEQEDGTSDQVTGAAFVKAIERLTSRPLLLALVSCQSAGSSYGDTLSALGPQLAQIGVPAVLAFQGNVLMSTVKALLPTLISELRRDGQYDRALAAARAALGDKKPWWQAVTWLRTDGRARALARAFDRAQTFNHAFDHTFVSALDHAFTSAIHCFKIFDHWKKYERQAFPLALDTIPAGQWRLSAKQLALLETYLSGTKRLLECLELAAVEDRQAILDQLLIVPSTSKWSSSKINWRAWFKF